MAYTYLSGGSSSLYGELVDAYLNKVKLNEVTDAESSTFLTKYVNDGGTESFMTVNYHVAYANVLEKAIQDSVSSGGGGGGSSGTGIKFGGVLQLPLNYTDGTNITALIIDSLVSPPTSLVLDGTSFAEYNNTYWIFSNLDSVVPSIRTVQVQNTPYVVQNMQAGILNSVDTGTTWTLSLFTNFNTSLGSESIGIDTTNGIALSLGITTDQNLTLNETEVNGEYTLDVNLPVLFGNLDAVPDTSIDTLNTALETIYSSLNVIGQFMAAVSANSTFVPNNQYILTVENTVDVVDITTEDLISTAVISSSITPPGP